MSTPVSPRNNQNQDEIVELMGADDWQQVASEYRGMTVEEIKSQFDYMWPQEEGNSEFAQRVYEAIKYQ